MVTRHAGASDDETAKPAKAAELVVRITFAPVGFELPLEVSVREDLEVKRVRVFIRKGDTELFRPFESSATGTGSYVASLPCALTDSPGEIEFFVRAYDAEGSEIARLGSATSPRKIAVVSQMPAGAELPRKPSGVAAARCAAPSPSPPSFWLGLDVEQAFLFVRPDDEVCLSDSWACTRQGRDVGTRDADSLKVSPGGAGRARGGGAWSTTRAIGSFEWLVLPRLALGGRVGYAFAGGNPTQLPGFWPFHLEARVTWFFQTTAAFRPYVALGGGMAQYDGLVRDVVAVPRDLADAEASTCPTPEDPERQCLVTRIDAYRTTGRQFVTLGLGAWYAFGASVAWNAQLKALIPFPTWSPGVALDLGVRIAL